MLSELQIAGEWQSNRSQLFHTACFPQNAEIVFAERPDMALFIFALDLSVGRDPKTSAVISLLCATLVTV
jgi:hypothetical protein